MDAPKQESFPQRVLRDMNDAVLVLDRQGHILYVNGPACEMLELRGDIKPGETRFAMDFVEPYNDGFYECIMDALYRKEQSHIHTVRYQAPSGKKYVFRMSSSYLADEAADLVVTLSDETDATLLKERVEESSRTFSTFLYAFCIWIILYALWETLGRPFAALHMTRGVEALGILMFLYITRYTKLSREDLGIAPEHPWKTVLSGIVIALGSVAFLFALKGVIRLFAPDSFEPDKPFWDIRAFGVPQLVYIYTAGIQEFLARSVVQGNLRRVMTGKHAAAEAIVLSSLVFAALHIHLGFLFMIGAALLAGLEGIVYEKQRSLYSLWIIHWLFGITGTMLHLIDH